MSCWSCDDTKLVQKKDSHEWECPKCEDIYYQCNKCPEEFDASDNNKGIDCTKCGKHYCIMCWQTTGELIDGDSDEKYFKDYEEGDYLCEKCINILHDK